MNPIYNFLLLKRGSLAKIYGPIDENIGKAQQNFIGRGYNAFRIPKPPAERTLRRWKQNKIMKSLDGCVVEGNSSCVHGSWSWGYICQLVKKSEKKLQKQKKVVN